jgi:hypothetical protein
MKVSEQSKTIAESIGCVFFEGTLPELNVDIERGNVDKDAWIFGFIPAGRWTITREEVSPVYEITYPFSAFIARQLNHPTIDHRTRDTQPTVDEAAALCAKFVEQFVLLESVKGNAKKEDYFKVDSHELNQIYGLDMHLFGTGFQCEFVISEGLTGCEL